jgi:hypothetical protein
MKQGTFEKEIFIESDAKIMINIIAETTHEEMPKRIKSFAEKNDSHLQSDRHLI